MAFGAGRSLGFTGDKASDSSVPELVAPAGDWDCAKAAVANGADAVYFGLDCGFNARAKAANFHLDNLPEVLAFLHRHCARGYVTLNTLAFSDELELLETVVRRVAAAGTDAVVVQDLGLVRLIRRIAPELPIHASTQMTLTSAEGIAVARRWGIGRVVLARELSVAEIAAIHARTSMTLEAFVHGAICIAYSGQCLASESLGGRSANRGQCAQPCRLPYELLCDGEPVDLGDRKYLLSPLDLAAYALVPELIAAGVAAMKIEGRLKAPEYVAGVTRHYRRAIDAAAAGSPVEFSRREIEELELSFSRGLSTGWLRGCDHKTLVPAASSAKRGVLVGHLREVRNGRIRVALCGRLKAGDGVVFEGDRAAEKEQGGRVFGIYRKGRRIAGEVLDGQVELSFQPGAIDLKELRPGQRVWKNDDPSLARRLRKSFAGDVRGRELPVMIAAAAEVGRPLRLTVRAEGLPEFDCAGEEPLAEAVRHPLTSEVLRHQLGRLGGTGFVLARLTASIEGEPMVPLSVLGKLRREMVAKLQAARDGAPSGWATRAEPVLPQLRREIARPAAAPAPPQLAVLCRSLGQLRAMIEHGVATVYADFRDLRGCREAASLARAGGSRIYLATPRIQKPGEVDDFDVLARCEPDGFLVRNLAGLEFFARRGATCVADFSLNAANELTVACLEELRAIRVTASYDLDRDQLLAMVRRGPADAIEFVVHQHVPMFHTEHCVFCAMLSPGVNRADCGRPCVGRDVRLRDRVGAEHPLKPDARCRNTLFHAVPRSGAEVVEPLVQLGVRWFRVELLRDDPPERLCRRVDLYRDLLAGSI
jgi:putative protease